MLTTQTKGFQQTHDLLRYVDQNAQLIGRTRLATSSPEVYAGGVETGRTRSGRLARRAGGAWMFRRGAEATAAHAPKVLAAAATKPPPATQNAITGVARYMTTAVRGGTPVLSGQLQGGITTRSTA